MALKLNCGHRKKQLFGSLTDPKTEGTVSEVFGILAQKVMNTIVPISKGDITQSPDWPPNLKKQA